MLLCFFCMGSDRGIKESFYDMGYYCSYRCLGWCVGCYCDILLFGVIDLIEYGVIEVLVW